MSGSAWTRREWLAACAAIPMAWPGRTGMTGHPAACLREALLAERLVATLGAPGSAARIGAQYLADSPAEASVTQLVRSLTRDTWPGSGTSAGAAQRMQSRRREDFESEDVVEVGGWLLARSEARLYALAALLYG